MAGNQTQTELAPTFVCATRFSPTVADRFNSLEGIDVKVIANRSTCWVREVELNYRWFQESVAVPNGITIIASTDFGVAQPGRWLLDPCCGGSGPGSVSPGGAMWSETLPPDVPPSQSFTTSGDFVFFPIGVAGLIDPTVNNQFDQPAIGSLRYIGPVPRPFDISYNLLMAWKDSSVPAPPRQEGFNTVLLLTPAVGPTVFFLRTVGNAALDLGGDGAVFHGDARLLLNPGDVLQIGMSASTPMPEDELMSFFYTSLHADS